MSLGWETTTEDVKNVLSQMDRSASEQEVEQIHNGLDMGEIESSALAGDDMEQQTEYAYVEIRRQIDCLDTFKKIE
jgi:hypothetical protein